MLLTIIEADKTRKQEAAEQSQSEARKAQAEEYQRILWSKILPSEVELRDPALRPQTYGDEFDLQASAKNLSDKPVGALEIEVTASDCTPRKICEIIGHATIEVWTEIPAQQVRGLSGSYLAQHAETAGRLVTDIQDREGVRRKYS